MANVDNPNGAKPVRTISGAPWQGLVRSYMADGSGEDIYIGDFVKLETDGYVDFADDTDVELLGVCVGFQPAQAGQTNMITDHFLGAASYDLSKKYYDASADGAAWILVAVGPDVVYEIQEDDAGTALALTDIGRNADITGTSGNATKGHSTNELDRSTVADANGQLRILAPINRPDNAIGDYCRWEVRINENHYTKIAGV